MEFENTQNNLILEQEQKNYELENNESELQFNNEEPQATFEDVSNELEFGAPNSNVNMDYNKSSNKPSINGVELIGDKTTEELGIVGTSMTEIELSTDISNPTEILNYINKSGTYVAKNLGIIGNNGEPVTAFAKGQFFTVSNLQEYYKAFGVEIPDNQNIIDVDARIIDGTYQTYRIIGGTRLEQIVWLNSENVNDYVNVNFNPNDYIDTYYGMQFYNGKLAIYSATITDIENGTNIYKPITPNNIDYAVQTKGNKYFAKKTDLTTLEKNVETLETNVDTLGTDLTTLKTEIETILESVVTIDE